MLSYLKEMWNDTAAPSEWDGSATSVESGRSILIGTVATLVFGGGPFFGRWLGWW